MRLTRNMIEIGVNSKSFFPQKRQWGIAETPVAVGYRLTGNKEIPGHQHRLTGLFYSSRGILHVSILQKRLYTKLLICQFSKLTRVSFLKDINSCCHKSLCSKLECTPLKRNKGTKDYGSSQQQAATFSHEYHIEYKESFGQINFCGYYLMEFSGGVSTTSELTSEFSQMWAATDLNRQFVLKPSLGFLLSNFSPKSF